MFLDANKSSENMKEDDQDFEEFYNKEKKIINQIKESFLLQNPANSDLAKETDFTNEIEEAILHKSSKLKSSNITGNNEDLIEFKKSPANSNISKNFTQQSTVSNSNPPSKNNIEYHSKKTNSENNSSQAGTEKAYLSNVNSNITNIDELKSEMEHQFGKGWELEIEKELEKFELKNDGVNLLECLNFQS